MKRHVLKHGKVLLIACAAAALGVGCDRQIAAPFPLAVDVPGDVAVVDAAQRFIESRYALLHSAIDSIEICLTQCKGGKADHRDHFIQGSYVGLEDERTTQRVIEDFVLQPQGAYLSDQDTAFLTRLCAQERSAYVLRVKALKARLKEKDGIESLLQLELLASASRATDAIRTLTDADLNSIAQQFHKKRKLQSSLPRWENGVASYCDELEIVDWFPISKAFTDSANQIVSEKLQRRDRKAAPWIETCSIILLNAGLQAPAGRPNRRLDEFGVTRLLGFQHAEELSERLVRALNTEAI